MMITINGEAYEMRYSVNSLCMIEERANMPIDRLMQRQFTATRLLLWAGLCQCQSELTVWDAGEIISDYISAGGSLEVIVDMCAEGLREAGLLYPVPFPDADSEAGEAT